jgi:hypothetical protein
MSKNDLERRWLNMQKISKTYNIRTSKGKEYNEIKKEIIEKI